MSRPRGHVQHSARKPDAFWPQVVLKSDLENHFSSLVDGSFCARTSRPCARCFRKPSRFAAEAAISLAQAGWAHPAGRKTLLGSLDGGGGWELADRKVIASVGLRKNARLLQVVKNFNPSLTGAYNVPSIQLNPPPPSKSRASERFSLTEDEPSCAELEYASPGCVFQDISAASSKSEPPCELFSGPQGLKTSRPEVGIHQNSRKCPRCSSWRLRF